MDWYFIIGLAFASSIDNLAVGLSYGVRKVRIGFGANLLIAAICFGFSMAGILFGEWIGQILPGELPDIVGAVLLFLIGVRILLLMAPRGKNSDKSGTGQRPPTSWLSKVLALESGKVGVFEAIVLGVALSANALANAVGAGLLHMPPIAIALTASIGSLATIAVGTALGTSAARLRIGDFDRFGTVISGATLVGLAIAQVWR